MRAPTSRQRLFVEFYALIGNGAQAAIRAGCNPASARTRASKWLAKDHIRRGMEEIRNRAFRQLRRQVADEILTAVEQGIQSSVNLRRTQRGLALATKSRSIFSTLSSQRRTRVSTNTMDSIGTRFELRPKMVWKASAPEALPP
jgi:hypothetical protein